MLKNIFKILVIFVIGMVGGIFADQIFWPYFIERPLFYQYRLEQQPIYLTETRENYIQENTALKEAIEKVEKTIVGVKSQTKKGKVLEGTGLIVTSDGLAVTLSDLVPRGGNFDFFVEGKKIDFEILKRDLKNNLVLVKLKNEKLSTSGFADLEKIKLGERVFLIGFLAGDSPQKIVNEGIIRTFGESLIETNIFENSNLEGSPLFDIEGNIIGLNVISPQNRVQTVPISKIRQFLGF